MAPHDLLHQQSRTERGNTDPGQRQSTIAHQLLLPGLGVYRPGCTGWLGPQNPWCVKPNVYRASHDTNTHL